MKRYLGIDGGGTKTAFVVIDEQARPVARALGPSSSSLAGDLTIVSRVLSDGVAEVLGAAGIAASDIDRAFFALPGYGELRGDEPKLDAIAGAVLGHERYSCGNDMIAGWAGSLGGGDGVNVVAGTGSIAYGERLGVAARSGGWSELFGDEGSGYWIGVHGLAAFSRMSDGRLARGPLYELMRQRLEVTDDLDALGVVHVDWAGRRDRIADLSRTVVVAADDGDSIAWGILQDAGAELAWMASAVRSAIGTPADERTIVSYSGGVFGAPIVLAAFRSALGEAFDVRAPVADPAIGAALYARNQAARTDR